ncbi:unnamed protein product [Phaedon cochleariae]|uniref:SCP domain-containing protein n=1 Tax=Phaedon cochleariae TaxID=80249 RepID=A0A9P0DFU5_PHACE|nr:unnamed protein product [Phaedon cochleariae]
MTRLISLLLNLAFVFKSSHAACADDWPTCRNGFANIACEVGGTCEGKGDCEIMEHDVEFRRFALEEHNKWRNYLALGKETRGGNGEAADMRALSYDVKLEFTARCNLVFCKMEHDKCHATSKFKSAGQNLYSQTGGSAAGTHKSVSLWYEECNDTTAEQIDHFKRSTHVHIGHFTQLVWSKVTHVGCSRSTTGKSWYVACNYGPSGNWKDDPVYKRGPACSACPHGTKCNAKYPGLCGEIDESDLKAIPLHGHRLGTSFLASLFLPALLAFLLM